MQMERLDSFLRLTVWGEISLLVKAFQVSQWLLFFIARRLGQDKKRGGTVWTSSDISHFLSFTGLPLILHCHIVSEHKNGCIFHVSEWFILWMVFYLHLLWNKTSCYLGFLHPWRVLAISPQLPANINIMNTSLPIDLIRQAKFWINPSTRLSSYS